MATHDYVIANQGFPSFRSDLNDALAAIVSNNSSATAPSDTFAHMSWDDTAADPSVVKMRNADNDAWITLFHLDQTNDASDIAVKNVAQTFTAKQTFSGASDAPAIEIKNAVEDGTVSATAATGTINFDVLTQSVLYYTTDATGNWTLNVRGDSSTTLSSLLDVGDSISIAFLVTNGATPYYESAFQVDGGSVTPKWQGGTAPTAGNASAIDVYSIVIIKTAATPTYTALASVTKFA